MSKFSTAVSNGISGKDGPDRNEHASASKAASGPATKRVQLRELLRDELREVSGGGGNNGLPSD